MLVSLEHEKQTVDTYMYVQISERWYIDEEESSKRRRRDKLYLQLKLDENIIDFAITRWGGGEGEDDDDSKEIE